MLRFDDKSPDFKTLNRHLWDLTYLDLNSLDESLSVYDYLKEFDTSDDMMALAAAGFANTLASNLEELSLKQCVHWAKEEHYDKTHSTNSPHTSAKFADCDAKLRSGSITEKVGHSDYRFKNSYATLIDHLKADLTIILNTPIARIDYSASEKNVCLHALNGKKFNAKRIVVTCSPEILKNPNLLTFEPALPTEKIEALDCVSMYTATKIILTFSSRPWPKGLHGMIMTGQLVPEVWFKEDSPTNESKKIPRDPSDDTSVETNSSTSSDDDSENSDDSVYMAIGFLTARFAEEAKACSHDEIISKLLSQLDHVFSHFKSEHLTANLEDKEITVFRNSKTEVQLPALVPSTVFVKGLVYDWATQHPYIGGAYASPKAGKPIDYANILAKPLNNKVFFAGEATNEDAGACTHSALETGVRAADELFKSLRSC